MPAVLSLEPQVKGRLADTEAAIIKLIQEGGDTWRTSISVEAALALATVRAADLAKRDFSNFLAIALEEYCQTHGAPAPALVEFFQKVQATPAADLLKLLPKLETTLRKSQRPARAATAA